MKSRNLFFVAITIFAISFLLPAYAGSTGYQCFVYCLDLVTQFPSENPLKWLYYFAFVPTNIVFVIMVGLHLLRDRHLKARVIVSMIAFFHVLSWLLINLRREDVVSIQVGYYFWLLAYALLLASQITGKTNVTEQHA